MIEPDRSTDRDSIQVIARAVAVLRIVSESPGGINLADISRRTGLARSTIQRIVKSLEDEHFLESVSGRGGYVLGQGLLALTGVAPPSVVDIAEPFLQELALTVDETVDLSVLRGKHALFVSHIAGSHRLSALSAIGTEFPLHSTANGKALLSCLPFDKRKELLDLPLSSDTPNTITEREFLLGQIDQVFRSGIAYDIEEHTEGVCAVGTAFLDAGGNPCAISIPVPRNRYFEKAANLEQPLLNCRSKIINALGLGRG